MVNERLRIAMAVGGWTHRALAEAAGVDTKTVERWVNLGRSPHRRTALATAELLREDVNALWPSLRQSRSSRVASSELVALHDQRAGLPATTFVDLIASARESVDVLVYAAVFLHEAYPGLNTLLKQRAESGCAIRIALGDADSTAVQQRGREEKFGHGIESRCRLALLHCQPLVGFPGIELRLHGTTLYNSLYRADNQLLVNSHLWGVNAYGAPVWHLRRDAQGGLFDTYVESFEAVWRTARSVEG